MCCGVINENRNQSGYAKENDREDNRKRPEYPSPSFSFPDLLYGIAQRENCCDSANRSEHEGRHKSIELTRPLTSMLQTIDRRQHDRNHVNRGDAIRNSEAYFAQHRPIVKPDFPRLQPRYHKRLNWNVWMTRLQHNFAFSEKACLSEERSRRGGRLPRRLYDRLSVEHHGFSTYCFAHAGKPPIPRRRTPRSNRFLRPLDKFLGRQRAKRKNLRQWRQSPRRVDSLRRHRALHPRHGHAHHAHCRR